MNRYHFACGASLLLSLLVATATLENPAYLMLGSISSCLLILMALIFMTKAGNVEDQGAYRIPTSRRF